MLEVTVLTLWGGQPWGFRGSNLWKNQSSGPNNNIQKVSMSNDLFMSLFLMKIFVTLKKPPFWRSILDTVLLKPSWVEQNCQRKLRSGMVQEWSQVSQTSFSQILSAPSLNKIFKSVSFFSVCQLQGFFW